MDSKTTQQPNATQAQPEEEEALEGRIDPSSEVVIRYTNYRGETADRRIVPIRIRFGSTEWHPEGQWLLEAFDLDRDATRAFALKDVLEWRPKPVDGNIRQV